MRDIRDESEKTFRSISGQLEYWLTIGKIVDHGVSSFDIQRLFSTERTFRLNIKKEK